MSDKEREQLKRRQAVEPVIGHLKADRRMARCWLKGFLGDAINTVMAAAGFNLRWLTRAMVRLLFLLTGYLALEHAIYGVLAAAIGIGDSQQRVSAYRLG